MYDIIIIGAGPAGMTAAIYARRAGKKVLVSTRFRHPRVMQGGDEPIHRYCRLLSAASAPKSSSVLREQYSASCITVALLSWT